MGVRSAPEISHAIVTRATIFGSLAFEIDKVITTGLGSPVYPWDLTLSLLSVLAVNQTDTLGSPPALSGQGEWRLMVLRLCHAIS